MERAIITMAGIGAALFVATIAIAAAATAFAPVTQALH
jgi:hypothetical protein